MFFLQIVLWGYAARCRPKRFRWRDGCHEFFDPSKPGFFPGRKPACFWMEMHFVDAFFCSLVFLCMVLGGCVCICVGLHLDSQQKSMDAHCVLPLWDRCRVRGREGTAFPFLKHLISPALVHLLAGKGRPWWKQWEEWGRFLISIGTWMWVAIAGILHLEGPKCAVCRRHRPENCFSKAVDKLLCHSFAVPLGPVLYPRVSSSTSPSPWGAADQAPQDCGFLE